MAINIIRVFLFVIVNIAGWYTIPVLASLAVKLDFFPSLPPGDPSLYFKFMFLGIGMWIWILCALISVGYFFVKDELKNWLLFLPMYGVGAYATAILIYFNFFYTVS